MIMRCIRRCDSDVLAPLIASFGTRSILHQSKQLAVKGRKFVINRSQARIQTGDSHAYRIHVS